jgi:hypothetical protein
MAAMYVAGLLTDWYDLSSSVIYLESALTVSLTRRRVVSTISASASGNDEPDVYIGRSEAAMWMRIVSSWICYLIYAWSL